MCLHLSLRLNFNSELIRVLTAFPKVHPVMPLRSLQTDSGTTKYQTQNLKTCVHCLYQPCDREYATLPELQFLCLFIGNNSCPATTWLRGSKTAYRKFSQSANGFNQHYVCVRLGPELFTIRREPVVWLASRPRLRHESSK